MFVIKSSWFKIVLKLMNIKYGKKLVLRGMPLIYKNKQAVMEIGDNVTINSSLLSNLAGMSRRTCIIARRKNSVIKIGNKVRISGASIYALKEITIGDGTLVGVGARIYDTDFHPIDSRYRNPDVVSEIKVLPVKIGKNCFIGANAIILKGTVLGDGCVVGAGAVVSGMFEANSVIVGNPAKVVKVLD